MRDVVNGESEGVVDDSPEKVRENSDPKVGELSDVVTGDDVEDDHSHDNVLKVIIWTH